MPKKQFGKRNLIKNLIKFNMREFSNQEMDITADFMFYEIVNQYIDFYNKGPNTKYIRIQLFEELEMILTWSKLKVIVTKYNWLNYTPNEDDIYLLSQLKDYFSPRTIKNIIFWFNKCSHSLN